MSNSRSVYGCLIRARIPGEPRRHTMTISGHYPIASDLERGFSDRGISPTSSRKQSTFKQDNASRKSLARFVLNEGSSVNYEALSSHSGDPHCHGQGNIGVFRRHCL